MRWMANRVRGGRVRFRGFLRVPCVAGQGYISSTRRGDERCLQRLNDSSRPKRAWARRTTSRSASCSRAAKASLCGTRKGNRYLDCLSAIRLSIRATASENPGCMVEQAGRLTLTSRAFHNDQLASFYERSRS